MRLPIASQPNDFKAAVNVTTLWDNSSTHLASTSLGGVRAGSEGTIVGGCCVPRRTTSGCGDNKTRQGSLGAAATLLEAAAAGSSSHRSAEPYHTASGSSVPAANAFGPSGASEHWYENLTYPAVYVLRSVVLYWILS
jgi:hypothetical protein